MKRCQAFFIVNLLPFIVMAQRVEDSTFLVRIRTVGIDPNTRIYLAYQFDGRKIIDSADRDTKTGSYSFSGKAGKPLHATLVADASRMGLPALIEKTTVSTRVDLLKLYVHPGLIDLNAVNSIANASFTGSVINEDNQKLQALLRSISDQQLAIGIRFRYSRDAKTSQQLARMLDSLNMMRKPILKQFVLEHPDSYIALEALMDYAGGFPDIAVIEPMFQRLSPAIKGSLVAKGYYKFLMDQKNLVSGVKAPEFVQNDTAGRPVSLSSFRGQYVLLDFWASWCGPCREENPHLRKIFDDFKNRNFTILGISLDGADGKIAWLKAINDDRLNWTQVSDLKHWDNEVAKLYSVPAIPQSFLIDPAGIIVARSLNHQQLREKLEELLPEK